MKIRTAILAGASLLAMTAHAHAFEAIGIMIVNAAFAIPGGVSALGFLFQAGASAAVIGQAFVGAALFAGNIAASLFMRPKVPTQSIKNTIKGAEGPGIHAFGRVEIKGRLIYGNTAGYNISRLIAHCFGEMDGVETYYYDGREITVEADGYVSSPPWARPPTEGTPSYMRVRTKVGDGTETAWDSLVSDFPSIWTADHRVRGIAQSLMRIISPGRSSTSASKKFTAMLQGGVKDLSLKARILKPYDPRTETSAWTMNGVLHVLHYIRALNGVTDADLDFDIIGDTADEGEVSVATLTGTAPRCQLSGGWEGPITTDIVGDMMESAGLDLFQGENGKWSLRFLEDWPDPEITFTSRHIIDVGLVAGPEAGRRPNTCALHYFSPERRYEKAEIDLTNAPWARVQSEIDAYGDQEFPCDLTYCCDASQAQRIARRMFWMARSDTGILKTTWAGMAAWGKRTGLIEIEDLGDDGESAFLRVWFHDGIRPNDADGTVEIPYIVIPEELSVPWDPETMEVPPPPVLVPTEAEGDLEQPGIPTGYAQVQYPGGGAHELRVRYTLPSGGDITEAVYRIKAGDAYGASQSMTEVGTPITFAYATTNQIGEDIDFRVRIFTNEGEGSRFSPALEIENVQIDNNAPGAPTVGVENYVGPGPEFPTLLRYTITTTALNVVRAVVEFTDNSGSSWSAFATHDNIRPGANVYNTNEQAAGGKGFRVRLYTSDLTPGTATGQAIA